jgi:hypothetical protein
MDVDQPESSMRGTNSTKAKPTVPASPQQPTGSGFRQGDGKVTGKRPWAATPEEILDNDEEETEQIDFDKLHFSVILESDTVHVSESPFCIMT